MIGTRGRTIVLAALTALCVAITLALFDRAYPLVDVGLRLSRDEAIGRARAIAATEGLALPGARAAARFESNDTLSTYVDLAAGGADSLRALVRGGPVAVHAWVVRLFVPGDPREAIVRLTPSGRVAGFVRTLAQDERRPTVSEAAGRVTADAALGRWSGASLAAWRFVSASYVTQPRSARIDRTYTYERIGVRVGAAPVRAEVRVTGDAGQTPNDSARAATLGVRVFAQVPDAFRRRYGEMRSANELYAALTVPALGAFLLAAFVALARLRALGVRWRPAAWTGGVIGALLLVVGLDAIPGAWFDYDTATSPVTFVAMLVIGAVASGLGAALFVTAVVAAAELLTRRAFPWHYDWWSYWRHRGASPVVARIFGGYVLAALGFAYVTLFYVATRSLFGWWVPTGTLDDPNQIASPLPWVTALGVSSFAGVWEEAVFRAVPLAIVAPWAAGRANGRAWMAAGVIVTALTFGFGHANYESWPAYSRGVELFLEAVLWAVLYLRVGLPTTIIGHALYDLVWFGLFSLHGTAAAYRVTFAVVLAAFLLPAIAVAHGWLARRRALAAGHAVVPPPRLGDWCAPDVAPAIAEVPNVAPMAARPAAPRWAAWSVVALALAILLGWPRAARLGPPFTASAARVRAAADSALRAHGADPARWRRFTTTETTTHGRVGRFLTQTLGTERARRLFATLAGSYLPASWWEVRYARTTGTVQERAEEWRVRVLPNGPVLDVARRIAEARPGASLSPDSARATAERALALAGVPRAAMRATLREVELEQTPRPARLDTRVEYEDTATRLPGGATARVVVLLAGDVVRSVTRRVELPESFERAERARASRQALVQAMASIATLGLVVACIVAALRRVVQPNAPPLVGRRASLALGAAMALASLAGSINALPALLAGWPTEQPWRTYLATGGLSIVVAAGAAGVATAALWRLTDGLRRRAGIPFWPERAEVAWAALDGAALGLGVMAAQSVVARSSASAWPVPRRTVADALLPWLDGALGMVPAALVGPTLAIAGLALVVALRPAARWAAIGVALFAAAAAAASGADRPALAFVAVVVGGAASVLTIRAFGGRAGLSWVLAALAVAGVAAARGAIGGETGADVVSGGLAVVTAAALGVVVLAVGRRN